MDGDAGAASSKKSVGPVGDQAVGSCHVTLIPEYGVIHLTGALNEAAALAGGALSAAGAPGDGTGIMYRRIGLCMYINERSSSLLFVLASTPHRARLDSTR